MSNILCAPVAVPVLTAVPFAVFNLVGDVAKARAEWKSRFENRKPPTGERKPKAAAIRAAAGDADTTDILLYDEIGYWGITAKEFITALAGITTPNICVRINSPGGDVFDGMAIYNALKTSQKKVTCVVDGLAASAASYIALAGVTVSIHESAMMMIHRAWGFGFGNAGDFEALVVVLNKIDGQIADIYAKQTGKSSDAMLALMKGDSDGTWFTAQEAADLGLVDEVIKPEDKTEENPVAPEPQDPPPPGDDPEMKKAIATMAMHRRRLALAEAEA